ncbi:MAG: hypothetical protein ACLFPM_05800 [Candidatus Izemoplasmatales bacterium]
MVNENNSTDELLFDEGSKVEMENNHTSQKENINPYRKAMMKYARNRESIIFLLLHLIPMVISWISLGIIIGADLTVEQAGQIYNLNWLKVFLILGIIITTIVPMALLIAYIGNLKHDIDKILLGLKTLNTYFKVIFWLIILLAVFFGMALLVFLFRNFLIAFILGVIGGLYFWLYIKFIQLIIDFINECKYTIKLEDSDARIRPRPMKFKNILIILSLIAIITLFINGFSFDVELPFTNPSTYQAFRLGNILAFIISVIYIIRLLFSIYLIQDLDRFLIITKRKMQKASESE